MIGYYVGMTKENAIVAATKIANQNKMVMAVVNDPISNNLEEEPDGPWGYCPAEAKRDGKFLLFPWATETILVKPS